MKIILTKHNTHDSNQNNKDIQCLKTYYMNLSKTLHEFDLLESKFMDLACR